MLSNNKAIVLLITCALNITISLYAMTEANIEQKLDQIAITEGKGYKAANLSILNDIGTTINQSLSTSQLSAYTISIPEFIALSSSTIQTLILNNDVDISKEWTTIITKNNFLEPAAFDKILENGHYPETFLNDCASLKAKITKACDYIIDKLGDNASLNELLSMETLDELIQKNSTTKFMVRSSGREDTKNLANAGGNVSVANVDPHPKAILQAISSVVASYFDQKSLIQRLGARDKSLADPIPLTPVIIQKMIYNADDTTRCGVMFTEETEGGIAKQNILNKDRSVKTTGITVIQSAYGHNEGVVNSLISVDTYYVTNENAIFSVLRPKTEQMVLGKKSGELIKKSNNPALINSSSLTKDMIFALKASAQQLEKTYTMPMDVEFVISEQEQKIFIVQARPIVYNQTTEKPSYFVDPNLLAGAKLQGTPIGVGNAAVILCNSPEEIIIAETINEALAVYQKSVNRHHVRSIIIGKMAPRTSHEATTFRGENKPVIYVQDWKKVQSWLTRQPCTIGISPQQGIIINFDDALNKTIKDLLNEKLIVYGWNNYPIEASLSLDNSLLPLGILNEKTLQQLVPITKSEHHPWKSALAIIKIEDKHTATIALRELVYDISKTTQTTLKNIALDEDLTNKIKLFMSYLLHCKDTIEKTLHIMPTDDLYTERLFAIRFLEALLYQQPSANDIINGYSVATVIAKELIPEKKIMQEAKKARIKLDDIDVQLMKIKDFAIVPETSEQWAKFVQELSLLSRPKDKKLKKTFSKFILQLGKANILSVWLNTSFLEKITTQKPITKTAYEFLNEFITQKDIFDTVTKTKQKISQFNKEKFANPESFTQYWQMFQDDLLSYFLNNDFLEAFHNANALGQLALLDTMSLLVETFDLSIKEVTGSTQYKDIKEKQVTNFYTMLKIYANIFARWGTLVPQKELLDEDILIIFNRIINNKLRPKVNPNAEELISSNNFNISTFTISSGTMPGILTTKGRGPKTYEDIFTTIHQNLIDIISILTKTNDHIKNITLPVLLENLTATLSRSLDLNSIGVHITSNNIQLIYNKPLRMHSLQIICEQKKHSTNAVLTLNFYGANEEMRWDKINLITSIVTKMFFAPIKTSIISEFNYSVTLLITNKTDLIKLSTFIKNMTQYSTGDNFNTNPQHLIEYASLIQENIDYILNPILKQSMILDMNKISVEKLDDK